MIWVVLISVLVFVGGFFCLVKWVSDISDRVDQLTEVMIQERKDLLEILKEVKPIDDKKESGLKDLCSCCIYHDNGLGYCDYYSRSIDGKRYCIRYKEARDVTHGVEYISRDDLMKRLIEVLARGEK